MSDRTEAERFDFLVEEGGKRFVETFMATFQRMTEGGRLPGVTIPSKGELLNLYRNTTEEYWLALQQQSPADAYAQLEDFRRLEG